MKVFGRRGGAFDSDYVAAIEDAIVLGADAINLSLGSAAAGNDRYYGEEVYQDILDALAASGAVVNIAAGNAGAWSSNANAQGLPYSDSMNFDRVGSPASYQNALAVASVDNIGATDVYMKVGDDLFFYDESGRTRNAPFASIAGTYEYVFIDGTGTAADWQALADVLPGRIAVCARGGISFADKASNAVRFGAAATLTYNNAPGIIRMNMDSYWSSNPCASITQADGALLKKAAEARTTTGGAAYSIGSVTVSSDAATVEASELPTGDLLLQVYDYALNVTTYRLHVGEALGIEEPNYDFLGFNVDYGDYKWLNFNKGAEKAEDYHGNAAMNTVYIAGTEVDGYVFALQEVDKLLYVMPMDDLENRTLLGKISTSYFTINDLCYNVKDGYLYGIVYIDNMVVRIDKLTGEAEVVGTFGASGDMRTIACDDSGNFYVTLYDYGQPAQLYTFTLDTITEPTLIGSTGYITDYYQAMTWNRSDGMLYWSQYKLGPGDEKDEGELVCIDPHTVTNGMVKTTVVGHHDEPISCLICPGSYTEGTAWYAKTTDVRSITISNETLQMVRGGAKQLTVDMKPWTLTTTAVSWTTSDATVATVDADGTVHAVDNGTATVTGTSVANPDWSVTCQVSVYTHQAMLHAIAEDAEGNSSLISWNMDTQEAPAAGIPISGRYSAAAYDPNAKVLYAQDTVQDVYAIHQIDPATGSELSVSPAQSQGYSFTDMTMTSYLAEGKAVVGQMSTAIFAPADPARNDAGEVMIDLTHQIDQMFGTRIVGMTSVGMGKKQYGPTPTYGEEFYTLDDLGNLWSGFAYYSSYAGKYYSYSPTQLGGTGIRTVLGYSFGKTDGVYPTTSMIYEPTSKTLFISLSREGKTYVFAVPMVTGDYGRIQAGQASLLAVCDIPAMHLYSVDYSGLRTEKAAAASVPDGGLTAVSGTVAPQSTVTVAHRQTNDDLTAHTEDIALSNEHPTTEVRNAKPATCTEDGYTGDTYCTVCGAADPAAKPGAPVNTGDPIPVALWLGAMVLSGLCACLLLFVSVKPSCG